MKKFFTRFTRLFVLIFFPGLLAAQTQPDYNILLNSGKFIPAENISSTHKTSDVFANSLFSGKHYVTIQFNFPTQYALKDKMKALGIEFIDYIPNLAYTASVSGPMYIWNCSRSFPLEVFFNLSTVLKTIPDLLAGQIPSFAIHKQVMLMLSLLRMKN